MEREMFLRDIEKRIETAPQGTVFVTSDFTDIASAQTANRALQRLENDGKIRRILRGVYEYPRYSSFLNEPIAASPDKVAEAIARNHGWRIVPSGDTALNMLGLSTQVPGTWSYMSDGPYKKYRFGNITMNFKRTAHKELTGMSDKTALIIQALKALGKDNVTDDRIFRIASLLTGKEKRDMLREARHTTAWIYEMIKMIGAYEVSA